MHFAPTQEQLDFAASLGNALAKADTPAVVRAWGSGDPAPGRALWSRLGDQGVLALGLAEEHGGFGASAVDLALAFEQLGRAAVPGPLVETVVVLPRLLVGSAHEDRLPAFGRGELIATLAAPPLVPYALDAPYADAVYLLDGDQLSTAQLVAPVRSVDAARRLAGVTADEELGSAAASAAALDAGTLATSAQLLGAGYALLERGTEYVQQRKQFGVAVGSFQAVKHLLADAAVALEFARPLLFAAALSLEVGAGTCPRDVSAAKVACGDAAYLAARVALQVHGAIGYTAEYDLSLWLTKVRALVGAYGTAGHHRARIAAALLAGEVG